MRVRCALRELRVGRKQTLEDMSSRTQISRGLLSEIERGIRPYDKDVPKLEVAYGAPWTAWYPAASAPMGTLSLLRDDEDGS